MNKIKNQSLIFEQLQNLLESTVNRNIKSVNVIKA